MEYVLFHKMVEKYVPLVYFNVQIDQLMIDAMNQSTTVDLNSTGG